MPRKFLILVNIAAAVVILLLFVQYQSEPRRRDATVGGGRTQGETLPELWEAPDFELLSSQGGTVSRGDLSGRVWVVDFIFTRCPGPCPRMTRQLLEVQNEFPAETPLRFVSITVDPAYDTTAVLADYARHYQADTRRWFFLTGPAGETLQLIVKGFFTAVERVGQADPDQIVDPSAILHGTHFLLVDRAGFVRGIYDSTDTESPQPLIRDIRKLLEEVRE